MWSRVPGSVMTVDPGYPKRQQIKQSSVTVDCMKQKQKYIIQRRERKGREIQQRREMPLPTIEPTEKKRTARLKFRICESTPTMENTLGTSGAMNVTYPFASRSMFCAFGAIGLLIWFLFGAAQSFFCGWST